jgi:hypothetical protein
MSINESRLIDFRTATSEEMRKATRELELFNISPKVFNYGLFPNAGQIEYSPLAASETLGFKVFLSGVMGFVMGGAISVFMGSNSSFMSRDPLAAELTSKQQMRLMLRQIKTNAGSSGRNFASFGIAIAGMEWFIERKRAKPRDIINPLLGGATAGALLAHRGGPTSMLIAALGVSAFTYGIEWYQHREVE